MTNDKAKWSEIVRYALNHQDTVKEMREKRQKQEYKKRLRKLIPIPIIVGLIAALVMYMLYGGHELFKSLLTWIIGLTFIATIIAYLPKNLAK